MHGCLYRINQITGPEELFDSDSSSGSGKTIWNTMLIKLLLRVL